MRHPPAIRFLPLVCALLVAGAASCGPSRGPTTGGSAVPPSSTGSDADAVAGSMDAVCASEPPASGLPCSNPSGWCVRPPTEERDGAHCYCKEGSTSCGPVLAHAPSGPCTTLVTRKDVLVYEGTVVVGYTCMCAGGPKSWWICNGPPPG